MTGKAFSKHISFRFLFLLLALLFFLAAPLFADSVYSPERRITKLADGVYTIRHKDPFPGWVNGNTTVIIGDREVFVVDSCQISSAAREDIAQIREWTSKPVRFLLNTHWHQDHNGGNKEYLDTFPGLAILAHHATRMMMDSTSPNIASEMLRDANKTRPVLQKRMDTGQGDDGKPLTDEKKTETVERLAQLDHLIAQAHSFVYQAPTFTFDRELNFDLGNREVEVRHLGRGNTAGDAVVYLPKEKILITGDLLVHPVPYAFDGYPTEWIQTLEALARLDADTIVPGHGEIEHDKLYLNLLIGLMKSIVAQVAEQLRINNDVPLDDVKKAIDIRSFRQKFAGDDKSAAGFFDYSVGVKFVELAYYELKQR
jgi:glyoxylase-like metal-dependent hydrolase (beta-lactamase superfamily II)